MKRTKTCLVVAVVLGFLAPTGCGEGYVGPGVLPPVVSDDPCRAQTHCRRVDGEPYCDPGYFISRNPDDPDDFTCVWPGEGVLPEPTGEPHSAHHWVDSTSLDTVVEASVEVNVVEVGNEGLHFWASNVRFFDGPGTPTTAWAHGGLLKKTDGLSANWGGLSTADDYDYRGSELATLDEVQMIYPQSQPLTWNLETWYRLRLYRVGQVVLPAGDYNLGAEVFTVPYKRSMYQWDFEIEDVDSGTVIWEHTLYTRAPYASPSWSYWTETGYGVTCSEQITVHWRNPLAASTDSGMVRPQKLTKSIAQSSCPDYATTEILVEDEDSWGTLQTYGRPRLPRSFNGEVLFAE